MSDVKRTHPPINEENMRALSEALEATSANIQKLPPQAVDIVCAHCGKEASMLVSPNSPTQPIYCSKRCSRRANDKRRQLKERTARREMCRTPWKIAYPRTPGGERTAEAVTARTGKRVYECSCGWLHHTSV